MAGIVTLLQQALVDRIEEKCRTNVPDGEPSRIDVVVRNRLQDDPTDKISVEVYHGHPNQTSWNDTIDMHEVGGGRLWRRRYSVKVQAFLEYLGADRDQASDIFGEAVGRVLACLQAPWGEVVDDYGERLIYQDQCDLISEPKGGPETSWIYEAWIRLEFVTYKEPSA